MFEENQKRLDLLYKMRKIIYLGTDPESGKGGIASAIKNSMALVSSRRAVGLIVTHKPVKNRFGNFFIFVLAFLKVLTFDRGAIFYLHVGPRGSLIRKLLLTWWIRLLGREVYVHYHSADFLSYIKNRGFWSCCLYLICKSANANIVLSKYWRRVFDSAFRSCFHIVFNPIAILSDDIVGNEIHRDNDGLIEIVTVSRLVPEKNIEEIFSLVARFGNVRLKIIGDGLHKSSLQNLAIEMGIEGKVSFLGWRSNDEVLSHVRKSDIFVLHSKLDSFGIVFIEALSVGTPVISSKLWPIVSIFSGMPGYLSVRSLADVDVDILRNLKGVDRRSVRECAMDRFGPDAFGRMIDSLW